MQSTSAYEFANSHKLRAPLTSILGFTYIFSHPDTKEQKDQINSMIVDASEELDDIVRTMLALKFDLILSL